MSTRPRRSSLKQKDASVDMLGLSRQEERMLQRAMYDSLRQKSQKCIVKPNLLKNRKISMTTRSKSLRKTLHLPISGDKRTSGSDIISMDSPSCSLAIVNKPQPEEQKPKRGTRYSPMRRLPLSEMLKSLEDRKNHFNMDKKYPSLSHKIKHSLPMKRHYPIVKKELISTKHLKINTEEVVARRPGRPRIIKTNPQIESLSHSKDIIIPPRISEKSFIPKTKRVPRTASLVARSSWINQNSSPSSPTRSSVRVSSIISEPNQIKSKGRIIKPKPEKLIQKPKKFIYNKKTLSQSQRISRVILATATQRFKKAKINEKISKKTQRMTTKIKSTKTLQDSKSKAVIPPELWLDPRGQPVDTEDFINFLIYRDTPYLDKSLKWFGVPPHKRKQRLYKIVPMENANFNETIVYNEKKEGGGREIVVQCQPPKLNDDGSELASLESDQVVVCTSFDDSKIRCPASVNSSCVTQAAIDEDISPPIRLVNGAVNNNNKNGNAEKPKLNKIKSTNKSDSKSIHIMEIRKRKN